MTLLEQAKALPMGDRARLAQDLWESLIESGYEPPLTPTQQAELDHRLKAHLENPDDVVPWETVRANLETKYGTP